MNSKTIVIETPLSPKELMEKLRSITITDFSQRHNAKHAVYYGEIGSYTFNIMSVQYGPMSSVPSIKGEIQDGINNTTINVKIDIKSHYTLARKMYYTTLLPIGIIVLLLSILVLGGTEYQVQGYIFSGSFIACALLVAVLTKSSLINTKKRELKNFASGINGKIVSV